MPADPVQSLWLDDGLSATARLSAASFVANGHEVDLYCYRPVADVPPGVVLKDARAIVPRDRVFVNRLDRRGAVGSNDFAFKLLMDRGGWWVDLDVICLQPLAFSAASVVAARESSQPGGGLLASTHVMRQAVGSPLMRWAWRACQQRDPERAHWDEIGPLVLDEGMQALRLEDDLASPRTFNPVAAGDWRRLIDPDAELEFGDDVFAVRLWQRVWREHGVDPASRFPEGCLYERLRARFQG